MIARFNMAVVLALSAFCAHADSDCAGLLQQRLQSDMDLSYEQFDQTMGSGFRALADAGCRQQAADLIIAYIAHNNAEQRSLRWHVAQLSAMHGDYERAIEYANSVLDDEEDFSVRALRWNDYVLATVAFLRNDLAALQRHRDRVEAGVADHDGNRLNLKLLDSLIQHFDQSYEHALKNIE